MSEYGNFASCLFVFHCRLKRDMDEDSEQNLEELIVTYFQRGFYMKTYLIFFRKDVILPSALERLITS